MATQALDPTATTAQGQSNYVSDGALGGSVPLPGFSQPTVAPKPLATTSPVTVASAGMAKTDLGAKNQALSGAEYEMQKQALIKQGNELVAQGQSLIEKDKADKLALEKAKIDSKNKVVGAVTGETPTAQQQIDSQMDRQVGTEETAYKDFQKQVNQIRSGTFPLTTYEQSSINAIQQSLASAKAAQEIANKNYTAGVTQADIMAGVGRYSPKIAQGNIMKAVSTGVAKVQDLEIKAAQAVSSMRMAFDEKNYKMVTDSYDRYTDLLDKRRKTIEETQKRVDEEAKQLADYNFKIQEQLEKDKNSISLTLAKNNAPAEVREAVANSTNYNEAVNAAAGYLQSEADILDIQYKKAQISKIYSDISNDRANAAGGLVDPAQIMAYASEYATNGKIPTGIPKGSFGMISAVAKELPRNPGEIIDTKTGVAPQNQGTYGDGISSLYSAVELSKQLKELNDQRWEGVTAGVAGKVFGSDDQQRYLDLRSQIVDLLARARSGAALTASEEARFSNMLPGRFGETTVFQFGPDTDLRIDNFTNTLSSDLKNKASSKGWAVNGISDVKIGGKSYVVGDIIQNEQGQQGRVNADGSITLIQ